MAGLWPLPRLIAHRGGGSLAPENTLAGIRAAAEFGCRAVEFDVMLSADGVPLLIHDETLARTTDGRGRVCDLTYAQLSMLDAGSGFSRRFAGESIPRLDDALDLCRSVGLAANIEIKPAKGADRQTGRIVAERAMARASGMPMVLSSFSLIALDEARKAAPDLPRGVLFDAPPADWLDIVRRADALSMHCNWTRLSAEVIAAARSVGVPLVVYTCDDPQQAQRLFDAGVASVITDRPDRLSNPACGNL